MRRRMRGTMSEKLTREGGLTDELFYASATALARRIRGRELSSEEVVRAHLWDRFR